MISCHQVIIWVALNVAYFSVASLGLADTKITVTYDFISTEISPDQKIKKIPEIRTYIMHDNNAIDFSGTGYGPSVQHLGNENHYVNKDGESYTASYHAENGILIITTDFAHYSSIRRIITDGKTKCRCTFEFIKKFGMKQFQTNTRDGIKYYSSLQAQNLTCNIKQTMD